MSVDKIKLKLPIPKVCDCCKSPNVVFKEVVTTRKVSITNPWFWAYVCEDCTARVHTHTNTYYPLGLMANRQTRILRAKAHSHFDKLWVRQVMGRSEAYYWLARELGLKRHECHIGLLSDENLQRVIDLTFNRYHELEKVYARREQKRIERDIKRSERSVKRCGLRLTVGKQQGFDSE